MDTNESYRLAGIQGGRRNTFAARIEVIELQTANPASQHVRLAARDFLYYDVSCFIGSVLETKPNLAKFQNPRAPIGGVGFEQLAVGGVEGTKSQSLAGGELDFGALGVATEVGKKHSPGPPD